MPSLPDLPDDLDDLLSRAHGYALSLAHDATRAEDLVQDACLSTLRARAGWSAPYPFRAVRSRFIDALRRETPLALVVTPEPDGEVTLADDRAFGPALPCDGTDLWAAMGQLRPEEREALYLAAVEGWTASEIGAWLDRPRATVLSIVHRAKRKLRRALAVTAPRISP
jgi:RNA polymerase sigma-70 factor (ECF subfamily)